MTSFQINDPTLESQWRAIILFGKNSATYKFAFAKSLLQLIKDGKSSATLKELAIPYSRYIIEHLKENDKQGSATTSGFLQYCRKFIKGEIADNELYDKTEKLGFVNVIDAFQNVNGSIIPSVFYEKDYGNGKKKIVITDSLLKLTESLQFGSFELETEARWRLVETAWNLNINPALLEVQYDETKEIFFVQNKIMRRVDITSVRDSLNGYQKGRCFYSHKPISVVSGNPDLCAIDHFLPHFNKLQHFPANINGVWNLVLADKKTNSEKNARIPTIKALESLYNRNEYFIDSKHPLAETIINQTGITKHQRRSFLQHHYNVALQNCIHTWEPKALDETSTL